jgi:hypothetical protein
MATPERPAFTVAGETFSWQDVVAAARMRGEWHAVEESAAQGLACLHRVTASGEELDEHVLEATEVEFRRSRRLLSGEETVEWVERHGLTVPEWRDYIRRAVARDRWAGELAETRVRFPVAENEVETVVWAEATCSGALDEMTWRLAGDAALAVDSGESLAGDRAESLSRIAAAAEQARAGAVADQAIADEVDRRGLEWLRIEGLLLEVPTEGMAREAAFLVRDDGRPLAEVAVDCGTEARALGLYMGEASSELSAALLGADEGELVGPLAFDDGFALLLLERKARPSTDDPEVRAKAEQAVVTRLTEHSIAANVSWHEPF